jgi:3-methyladenine DNA glycosylase AlkD
MRAHEKEFFIQKAIGWALRDYARHAPQEVREFISAEKGKLSPLSYREANKHLASDT